MNEGLGPELDGGALTVPGFETESDAHRAAFTSIDEPHRTVVWRISADALSQHVAALRQDAQDAWGRGTPEASGCRLSTSRRP